MQLGPEEKQSKIKETISMIRKLRTQNKRELSTVTGVGQECGGTGAEARAVIRAFSSILLLLTAQARSPRALSTIF